MPKGTRRRQKSSSNVTCYVMTPTRATCDPNPRHFFSSFAWPTSEISSKGLRPEELGLTHSRLVPFFLFFGLPRGPQIRQVNRLPREKVFVPAGYSPLPVWADSFPRLADLQN